MCDIIIATPRATKHKLLLFGKNSDRFPDEPQVLEVIPRTRHEEETLKLRYVELPQVKETYAVLISRPWWTYGAEMGVNEHGLVIGNVAVFTKEPYEKKGLLGMEILRLALERTRTARDALRFIINLIEEVGQGGSHAYNRKFMYHNSFIIADKTGEAWVLETAGRYWAAKKIDTVYSVSNALTITNDWDLAHDELVKHGVAKHGCSKDDFNFSKCYSDRIITYLAKGRERRKFTYSKLLEKEGAIDEYYAIKILRSHHKELYHPAKGSMKDICMHYGGPLRPTQTASSMIVLLKNNSHLVFATGASNPCLTMYKPVTIESGIPILKIPATNRYDPSVYWWKIEYLNRKIQLCYDKVAHYHTTKVYEAEKYIMEKILKFFYSGKLSKQVIKAIVYQAFSLEEEIIKRDLEFFKRVNCRTSLLYTLFLRYISKKVYMNI
ncbi:MAG: C69 family dipeptidase [Staphylothermus sp.]|nr:C69 family dipeptidase [Staphylothermus sp.]